MTAKLPDIIEAQMAACLRKGVSDDFQAGYLEALRWAWAQAGYKETGTTIAARAMVEAHIVSH